MENLNWEEGTSILIKYTLSLVALMAPKNKYNIIKQEYGVYSILIELTNVEAPKCHKSGRLETLNFKSEGFPKLIPRSCEKFLQDPSTCQNPWEPSPTPESQNMATSTCV